MIKENLEEVREKIRQACQRSGRREEDVTLISVSKTKPVEMLREAYEAGSRVSEKTGFRKLWRNTGRCRRTCAGT